MLKKLIPTLCAALFLCAAHAQQTEVQQEPQVRTTIKIFKWAYSNAMSIPTMDGKGSTSVRSNDNENFSLWYKDGEQWRELPVVSGSMSRSISYSGPQTMIMYRKTTDAEGKDSYSQACKLMLPSGVDEVFAMMFKNGASVRFYPMNVSPKTLPKEKVAIINMTSHRIGILANKANTFINPGSNVILTPKRKHNFAIDLTIARYVNKKWTPVYQNNISTPENRRCVVLIYDPYNKKSPKFNIQVLSL